MIQFIKEHLKKGLSLFVKTMMYHTVNDHLPLEAVENLIVKHRPEDSAKKIAVFQGGMALQSHTVNFVLSLVANGLNVDLFLYQVNSDLVDMGQINNNNKIKIYDLSNFPDSETLLNKYAMLLRGDYLFFIGIEKKGLITAGKLAERYKVPTIYFSLELYIEENISRNSDNWISILRADEIKYHQHSIATIIQDRCRAEKLLQGNRIDQIDHQILYFPVSVPESRNLHKQNYFHKTFGIDESKKILLYFGLIHEDRYCLELARLSQDLPENHVMVFHGYFESDKERHAIEKYKSDTLIISSEMVGQKQIKNIISSADIGLVFYRNDCINQRLTAFSSEKIALFMQSGVPIISFKNESYSELFCHYKCGEAIESLDSFNCALSVIMQNYENYRGQAYEAFDNYYNFDSNFNKIRYFFQ